MKVDTMMWTSLRISRLCFDYHSAWYYGKHEDVESLYGNNAEQLKTTAVDALQIG
jgi:hypothetical protein